MAAVDPTLEAGARAVNLTPEILARHPGVASLFDQVRAGPRRTASLAYPENEAERLFRAFEREFYADPAPARFLLGRYEGSYYAVRVYEITH